MLARLAENLFWAGRYVERAEDTARMLDVTYHTLLESPPQEAERAYGQLLEVLHLDGPYAAAHPRVEAAEVLRFLVLDRANPSSILSSVLRARENGRSVRELISVELWESLNDLHLELRGRDLDHELSEQPFALLALVKTRCQTISGVAMETLPRDESWRFLTLGRQLERAEMTCRLVGARYSQLVDDAPTGAGRGVRSDFHDWGAVLKSASAFQAYRRAYRASTHPAHVVEFLLLARDLPRSVLFCLQTAERQLEWLAAGAPSRAQRRLARMRSSLEYRDVAELLAEGLHDFLDDLHEGVAVVADGIGHEFFRHGEPGGGLQPIVAS